MPGEGGDPQAAADSPAPDGRGHDASQCQEGRRHPARGQEVSGIIVRSSNMGWHDARFEDETVGSVPPKSVDEMMEVNNGEILEYLKNKVTINF